jgi:hypothetical protein
VKRGRRSRRRRRRRGKENKPHTLMIGKLKTNQTINNK